MTKKILQKIIMRKKYMKTIEKELCGELDGCGVGKLEY
jgi:hypothetical protein